MMRNALQLDAPAQGPGSEDKCTYYDDSVAQPRSARNLGQLHWPTPRPDSSAAHVVEVGNTLSHQGM